VAIDLCKRIKVLELQESISQVDRDCRENINRRRIIMGRIMLDRLPVTRDAVRHLSIGLDFLCRQSGREGFHEQTVLLAIARNFRPGIFEDIDGQCEFDRNPGRVVAHSDFRLSDRSGSTFDPMKTRFYIGASGDLDKSKHEIDAERERGVENGYKFAELPSISAVTNDLVTAVMHSYPDISLYPLNEEYDAIGNATCAVSGFPGIFWITTQLREVQSGIPTYHSTLRLYDGSNPSIAEQFANKDIMTPLEFGSFLYDINCNNAGKEDFHPTLFWQRSVPLRADQQ
jgi:hypothetical protein